MIVVAVASGTSGDGLDVGVVSLEWTPDGDVSLAVLDDRTEPWPDDLGERLLALLAPATASARTWCELDTEVGRAVGGAARRALAGAGAGAELVVSPGQTVHHEVREGRALGTLQVGQPAWVVEATGLPVVSDLRARDVSAGGHGAPLASTLDALWLAGPGGPRAALNLGGIANVTVVGSPGDPVTAWDTGPANCLLDIAATLVSNGTLRCDVDGAMAARGRVRTDLLDRLLGHPYFDLRPPVSTGRETFSAGLLDEALAEIGPVDGDDLLATLTELTAVTVANALEPYAPVEVVGSGGGTLNPALMSALRRTLAPATLTTSTDRGIPVLAKEVVMWALLGFLTWHGVSGSSAATGAPVARVLGRISPGNRPLVLPEPVRRPPGRLHVRTSSEVTR